MSLDRWKGEWKRLRGEVRKQWGKLTDDDLERIAGKRDELLGRIQERYGVAREEAEKRVREWESRSA